MNENLDEALNQISDEHISEATRRKSRKHFFFASVAALLAVVIGWTAVWYDWNQNGDPTVPIILETDPTTPTKPSDSTVSTIPTTPVNPPDPAPPVIVPLTGQVAQPTYPRMVSHPALHDGVSWEEYHADQHNQHNQPEGYADTLTPFFKESIAGFLRDSNSTCSPLNVYMALAMLAEVSDGNTRQEILDLMGLDSIEALRTQAGHVWNAHYQADGATTSLLANSLWLDENYRYVQSTANTLADSYYASVFHGNLSSTDMTNQLQSWLNEQTDGLLRDQVQNVALPPNTAFALASTINYRVKWGQTFSEHLNTTGPFHSPSGDTTVTFMHQTLEEHTYYYGDTYGAVALRLEDGGQMWLILPDEGITTRQLLQEGDCIDTVLGINRQERTMDVILTLPKFDISSNMNLTEPIQDLGVTDAFNGATADFSPLISDVKGVFVDTITHAARVKIDEEGLEAVAYTVIIAPGSTPPKDIDEIEFTLDRPFLFVITSPDGLPLFAGTVAQP